MDNIFLFLILVILTFYIFLPPDNAKINLNIFIEILEMPSILILIFYSNKYNKNSFLNSFMLSIAFIEHIRQYILAYNNHNNQWGGSLRNLLLGIIYIILTVYNIIHLNYLFILVWTIGIIFKIVKYYSLN
jgi:hypothetical protein